MTPMPVNPIVVLLVNESGTVLNDRNNIGNDLKVVTTHSQAEFDAAGAGVPYSGTNPVSQQTQVLAGRKK